MTYEEQLQYYADLLILQYRGKPKAQATIQALARQALCDNISIAIRDAFSVADAIGVQLDVVGKYADVERNVLTLTGGTRLNDTDFRTLILFAFALNACKGSLYDIETLLYQYFGTGIIVFDNKNMTMSYFLNATVGSLALLEAIIELDLLPRPLGVALASIIYAVGLDDYFAFSNYFSPWGAGISGFTSYYDGTTGFTGDTHIGTKIIDNIPNTGILTAGNPITGLGIDTETFIDTIDSPTQITTTVNSLANHTAATLYTQELSPWINYGDVVSL